MQSNTADPVLYVLVYEHEEHRWCYHTRRASGNKGPRAIGFQNSAAAKSAATAAYPDVKIEIIDNTSPNFRITNG